MEDYIVKKPHKGDRMYQAGDKRTLDKRKAQKLIDKGLVFPKYMTKEDKNAYSARNKAYIVEDSPGWFVIKREGDVISDKKYRKSEAIEKRDEINAA